MGGSATGFATNCLGQSPLNREGSRIRVVHIFKSLYLALNSLTYTLDYKSQKFVDWSLLVRSFINPNDPIAYFTMVIYSGYASIIVFDPIAA